MTSGGTDAPHLPPEEAALQAFAESPCARVAVRAVPGAGKTRLLLRACATKRKCLLLAYNAHLASQVQKHIQHTPHVCLTFHALCSRCLAPARDDIQLERVVRMAEVGEVEPHDLIEDVDAVLIDEAQDVRSLYVRLVRVLGYAGDRPSTSCLSLMVAGDERQLVYDFDSRFPATLDTLLHPKRAFGGGDANVWQHFELQASHRITRPMAALVNAVFDTHIVSHRTDGPEVQVRAPKSAYTLYDCLRDLLVPPPSSGSSPRTFHPPLILFDRKASNRPLMALLNAISRAGHVRLRLHGIDEANEQDEDADEDDVSRPVVCAASYWSAKGLESDTVIVLLPERAPANPTFVALTRALRRLVVVLDPKEPHAAVCRAVRSDMDAYDVLGIHAFTTIEHGSERDGAASLMGVERGTVDTMSDGGPRRCLDWHVPSGFSTSASSSPEVRLGDEDGKRSTPPDEKCHKRSMDGIDLSGTFVTMARVACELHFTGRVTAFEHILFPTRMDARKCREAQELGFVGRAVPVSVSDDALLANDLRALALPAYSRLCSADPYADEAEKRADLALVSLAIRAWDNYDHIMRQLLPVSRWCAMAAPVVERSLAVLHRACTRRGGGEGDDEGGTLSKIAFDTRLWNSEGQHVRVHAHCDHCVFHFVASDPSPDDLIHARLRASFHPSNTACLVH